MGADIWALARERWPHCAAEAEDLLRVAMLDPDDGARSCAVAALERLPQEPIPAGPTLPDPEAPEHRIVRRLGLAVTLEAALLEWQFRAQEFSDDELSRALRAAHGRMLGHVMAARAALGGKK